jgi:hypothetical protein
MYDISVTTRKAVDKARDAKFAASWSNAEFGDAGVERTRKAPVSLSDRNWRVLDRFTALVPAERRAAYRSAVLARLSGFPGDAAVHTAAVNAALDGYLSIEALAEHGLVGLNSRGFVRPQHNERAKSSWQSNAITGRGAGR